VLWVGLEDGEGRLAALAAAVAEALRPIGFPPEKRAWAAHLTLARLRTPANVATVLDEPVPTIPFKVAEVTLFRSRLARPSPTYETLTRLPLAR
jgi:2'-5' RNA ligase